jgi:NADPH-dependent curcumin reductase CurA
LRQSCSRRCASARVEFRLGVQQQHTFKTASKHLAGVESFDARQGTGKLRPRETVAQGLEAAPDAFLGLLKGKNFGKQLVKLI